MLNKQKANLPRANDQTTIIRQTNKSPILSSPYSPTNKQRANDITNNQYKTTFLFNALQTEKKTSDTKLTNRKKQQTNKSPLVPSILFN